MCWLIRKHFDKDSRRTRAALTQPAIYLVINESAHITYEPFLQKRDVESRPYLRRKTR